MPDDTTAPDPVTALLDAMYDRRGEDRVLEDLTCLIRAVRAGLALADDWAATQGDGPGYNATRACGIRVRWAITAALLGEVLA